MTLGGRGRQPQLWLMSLTLQGQGINMMLFKHKWSAVRPHNHSLSSSQTGLIEDMSGSDNR